MVVDDGTTTDEGKLGAIGDLDLVIRKFGLAEDLLVAAGDSIFGEGRLDEFARFGAERDASAIAVRDVRNREEIRRYSAVSVDGDDRIVGFVEKPEESTSTLAGIALYFYPRWVVPLVRTYLEEGNDPDQPGRLVQWLYPRVPFYAWRLPGRWYDIGSPETLAQAEREFSQS